MIREAAHGELRYGHAHAENRLTLCPDPLDRQRVAEEQSKNMSHDFSTLSPADFEDLTRDLLGRELRYPL